MKLWQDGEVPWWEHPPVAADRREEREGGDPACWMHVVCEHCGLMPDEDPPPQRCPRCGEVRDRADD